MISYKNIITVWPFLDSNFFSFISKMSELSQTLIFSGRNLSYFPQVSEDTNIYKLDLSNNRMTNFSGMKTYRSLIQLLADDNPKLSSFKGISNHNQLQHFSCKNTPLGNSANIVLMAVIIFGKSLEFVNGKKVPESMYPKAENLKPHVLKYLLDGWLITNINPIKIIHPETRKRKTIYYDQIKVKKTENPANVEPESNKPLSVYSVSETSSVVNNEEQLHEEEEEEELASEPHPMMDDSELHERFMKIHEDYVNKEMLPNREIISSRNSDYGNSNKRESLYQSSLEKRPISPLGSPPTPYEQELKLKTIGTFGRPPKLPDNWVKFTSSRSASRQKFRESQEIQENEYIERQNAEEEEDHIQQQPNHFEEEDVQQQNQIEEIDSVQTYPDEEPQSINE